jgi:hypothetical protein
MGDVMNKALIDRWTETLAFRATLLVSGVIVLPVLALGLLTTLWILALAASRPEVSFFDGGPIFFLSAGGAVGIVGLWRAHWGDKGAARHNVGVTIVCLAIGIATALSVAGLVIAEVASDALEFGRWQAWSWISALFATAHICWVLWGIGSMQRLARCYAERTGRAFDGMPVAVLSVAIVLATTAMLITTTL